LGNLIEQILLSDFTVFALLALAVLVITNWARTLREGAGYLLGWLIGLFLIIVLSALFPYAVVAPIDPAGPTVQRSLTFFQLIIPSIFGLFIGFGLLFVIRIGGNSDRRVGRALTVAALLSFTLTTGYLILRNPVSERWGLAVFALTFAIGSLLNFIFTRGTSRNLVSET
jgi:hypothetical protein